MPTRWTLLSRALDLECIKKRKVKQQQQREQQRMAPLRARDVIDYTLRIFVDTTMEMDADMCFLFVFLNVLDPASMISVTSLSLRSAART